MEHLFSQEDAQAELTLKDRTVGLLYDVNGAEIVHSTRRDLLEVFGRKGFPNIEIPIDCSSSTVKDETIRSLEKIDFVCKVVHGIANRTGLVQGIIEAVGKVHTGTSLHTDLLVRGKVIMKTLMQALDIPTPRFLSLVDHSNAALDELVQSCVSGQFLLKPVRTNSSIGMIHCENEKVLRERMRGLPSNLGYYFVEEFIPGRIITVGVVPLHKGVFTVPPMEYVLGAGKLIMDHDWKMHPKREAPAKITSIQEEELQKYARALHETVGAEGITRTDFILGEDGNLYTLEINSNVGLSRNHDVPTAFCATEHSYDDLVISHLATALNKVNSPRASI